MIAKRRYSPLLILFEVFEVIKNNFFAIIILFFTTQATSGIMVFIRYGLVVLIVLSFLQAIVNWFVKKYEANDYAFILYSGIFNRKEQTIAFERIQNIHTSKNVIHRLFKATSLTLETASSGDDSTVKFPVLRESEADEIREIVQQQKASLKEESVQEMTEEEELELTNDEVSFEQTQEDLNESEIKEKPVVHFRPTKKDLLIASFASFNFLIIIPVIFFLIQIVEQIFNVEEEVIEGAISWFSSLSMSLIFYIFAIVLILVISAGFGIVWTFLNYGNYELSSDEDTIYIRKGIWEEKHLTIKKSRVQGIQLEQNILKRMLRLTSVKLVMIQDEESDVSVLYPFLPKKRAIEIIETILPQYEIREETKKLEKAAFSVRFLTTTTFFAILSIPPFIIQPELFGKAWLPLIIGPALYILTIIYRYLQYKQTTYRFDEQFIQWTIGGLGTLSFITTRKQIIEVDVDRGPLQRLFGLRSISVSNRGKPVTINGLSDMPSDDALLFIDWYYEREKDIVRIDDSYVNQAENRLEK